MNNFNIEKRIDGNNEVSFCKEKGGFITSLKFSGKEILYFDEETFLDPHKSTRGGIPILFPNAGAIENDKVFDLAQHGFARNMAWDHISGDQLFQYVLYSNKETLNQYPFHFEYHFSGNFSSENSFTVNQEIINTGDRDMPVSCGLHPYFKVSSSEKDKIQFNFPGGDICIAESEKWKNGEFVSVKNPKVFDQNNNIEVFIPGIGTLAFDVPIEYTYIWFWSESGKDFICIEPVMENPNGIIDNPHIIKARTSLDISYRIHLL